jgi:hypothetical protein
MIQVGCPLSVTLNAISNQKQVTGNSFIPNSLKDMLSARVPVLK